MGSSITFEVREKEEKKEIIWKVRVSRFNCWWKIDVCKFAREGKCSVAEITVSRMAKEEALIAGQLCYIAAWEKL